MNVPKINISSVHYWKSSALVFATFLTAWSQPFSFSLVAKEIRARKPQVRTTAYTHTERDHLRYGRKTAAGTQLISGNENSAAADWSFLPLGTRFKIKGDSTIYTVEDYGGALVGTQTVDIYCPSKTSMNRWGVRFVEIEILEDGCRARSIELLKGRTHSSHCRRMLESLLEQV